jgi:hypothetical protein
MLALADLGGMRRYGVRRVTRWRCGVAVAVVACAACTGEAKRGASPTGKPTAKATATASPSARSSGSANRPRSQPPMPGCVLGWVEPKRNTPLRSLPLTVLRESQGFKAAFSVLDMRYFKGPDDTNLAPEGNPTEVERWYAKVVYTKDKRFKLRMLVRRSSVGASVVAIAPFATSGFTGSDWRGIEGEGDPRTYPGLPGQWSGTAYDYVAAGELPPQVVGCLAG